MKNLIKKISKQTVYKTNFIKCCFVIVMLVILIACNKKVEEKNNIILKNAAELIDSNPHEAINLLKTIEVGLLDKDDYSYFILLQIYAWDKEGVNISTSEEAAIHSKNYFVNRNNAPKAAFAYYVLAKIYFAQNKQLKTLHCFEEAENWAAKANYNIPYFSYSSIPYNLSSFLYDEKRYEEGINYANKALKFAETNGIYDTKLYALELKALHFQQLSMLDSAYYYYTKALKIANNYNDIKSMERINVNMCTLFLKGKQYDFFENKCQEIINSSKEKNTINTGRFYLSMAAIYNEKNKINLAQININKAKNLLDSADYPTKLALFKLLSKIEQNSGNKVKSTEYLKKYNELKLEAQNTKKSELEELQAELIKQKEEQQAERINDALEAINKNWELSQKQLKHSQITNYILIACLLIIVVLLFKVRNVKRDEQELEQIRKLGKEGILRNLLQHKDLIILLEWISDNFERSPKINELMNRIDSMIPSAHWSDRPRFLHVHYHKMFENIKKEFPSLNNDEYKVLCLICTKLFKSHEIASILRIEIEELNTIKKSIENKLGAIGYTIKKVINYSQKNFTILPTEQYN